MVKLFSINIAKRIWIGIFTTAIQFGLSAILLVRSNRITVCYTYKSVMIILHMSYTKLYPTVLQVRMSSAVGLVRIHDQ